MKIININPLTKKRIKVMTKSLIPWIGYVRVTYSGLVTLKAKWWSLRRTRLSVTDLCLHELPRRIAKSAAENNMGQGHELLFKDVIAGYLGLNFGNRNYDLVEYIWEMFNKYHMRIPSITVIPNLVRPIGLRNETIELLPILTLTSYSDSYGVHRIFRNFNKEIIRKNARKLIKKIKLMQDNLPVLIHPRIFTLNL